MSARRRRSPQSQIRELAKRVSIERLADRFGRSAKTVKAWLTQGPPARVRDAIDEAYERSERARRAAETRAEAARAAEREARAAEREARRRAAEREAARELRRQEAERERRRAEREAKRLEKERAEQRAFDKRSKASKRGWSRRHMRNARVELGPHETGRTVTGHHLLRGLLGGSGVQPDSTWLDFLERCRELGFTVSEARDEWFSPELIG